MITGLTGLTLAVTVVAMWGDWWWLFAVGCVGLLALVVAWSTAFLRGRLRGQDTLVLAANGLALGVASVLWSRTVPDTTVFHPVIASHLLALLYTGLAFSVAAWRWARRR